MPVDIDIFGTHNIPRWYFGGLASSGATLFTHPLDVLKVMLQTQHAGKLTLRQMLRNTIQSYGVLGLYSGISAAILRQMTYSTTRFAIYDTAKEHFVEEDMTFGGRIGLAALGGFAGGFVGIPADLVNVRMQNDVRLPPQLKRNYKHCFDGLWRTYSEEGFFSLFNGGVFALARCVMMTIGQIAFYDEVKYLMINTVYFEDNFETHLLASIVAGAVATTLSQPMDVIKTRAMSAKPGHFKSSWAIVGYTAKLGPLAFFKGYIPAFVRLGPQTILTFLFYEELTILIGKKPTYGRK